jgi:hypothetical protein
MVNAQVPRALLSMHRPSGKPTAPLRLAEFKSEAVRMLRDDRRQRALVVHFMREYHALS